MRGVVSPDRDISTSEGQRPGQSTAFLRSVDDIYIKDAPYVRTGWVNTRLCRVRFCGICLILLIMEIGGFYVEIIDI